MPGLTRNSADFADICDRLAGDYRLIVAEQRGRGKSQYDSNPENYVPEIYVQDMFALIEKLQPGNLVLLGTSLGGLMAMLMNALRPGWFKALIINDIGPEIAEEGLMRIRSYVGKTPPVTNWQEAAETARTMNLVAFPHYQAADWLTFARRLYEEDSAGIPQLMYDPALFDAQGETPSVPPDLWPLFEATRSIPCLCLRGELSDMLSPECFAKMRRQSPDMVAVEIPGVGHAPMLDEPGSVQAITRFLAGL